jgi:hypothetical protein
MLQVSISICSKIIKKNIRVQHAKVAVVASSDYLYHLIPFFLINFTIHVLSNNYRLRKRPPASKQWIAKSLAILRLSPHIAYTSNARILPVQSIRSRLVNKNCSFTFTTHHTKLDWIQKNNNNYNSSQGFNWIVFCYNSKYQTLMHQGWAWVQQMWSS